MKSNNIETRLRRLEVASTVAEAVIVGKQRYPGEPDAAVLARASEGKRVDANTLRVIVRTF